MSDIDPAAAPAPPASPPPALASLSSPPTPTDRTNTVCLSIAGVITLAQLVAIVCGVDMAKVIAIGSPLLGACLMAFQRKNANG